MEKVGGVYKVPCKVNGLALKFIFDTGASDVSISSAEAVFMLKNGYMNADDLGGSEYYRIANGDIAEGTKVVLRKIEIGDKTLYNVEASIVHSMDAPLLLGQSVMERLGQFTIDYATNSLIIGKQSGITKNNIVQSKTSDYPSVKIGNQVWMTENLNVDRFRNGDLITNAQTNEEWKNAEQNKQPAWCYFNNDPTNGVTFGKLYNWYAMADIRGVCPTGWHIPLKNDWVILRKKVGEDGNKLKSKREWIGNKTTNLDEFNFNGLPGGTRSLYFSSWSKSNISFFDLGKGAHWWSSTILDGNKSYSVFIFGEGGFFDSEGDKNNGKSIRCIKD